MNSIYSDAGWVTITVDVPGIFARAKTCKYFSATVWASSVGDNLYGYSFAIPGHPNGFSLMATDSSFAALVAAESSLTRAEVQQRTWNEPVETARLFRLSVYIHSGQTLANVYWLDWKKTSTTSLVYNVSQACVFDWIGSDIASCTFTVPAAANYVTLSVEQSRFDSPRNYVSVYFVRKKRGGHSTRVSHSLRCGGTYGFMGAAPIPNACQTYLNCTTQFLYDDYNTNESDPIVAITVTVPRTANLEQACLTSAVVVADFNYLEKPRPAAECDYLCLFSRDCITYAAVCDGAIDCLDGADEANCTTFEVAEDGMRFNDSSAAVHSGLTYVGCMQRALGAGSLVFAHSLSGGCVTYSQAHSITMAADPLRYLVDEPVYKLYRSSSTVYNRCTRRNTCSGRGSVRIASGVCSCFCDVGYAGVSCEKAVQMTEFAGFVIGFPVNHTAHLSDLMADSEETLDLMFPGFRCAHVVVHDADTIGVLCTGGTVTAEQRLSVLDAAGTTLVDFNNDLRPEDDRATYLGLYSSPGLTALSTCTLNGNASCLLPSAPVKHVAVTWSQGEGAPAISVLVTRAGSASRRSGGTTTNMTCDPAAAITVQAPSEVACGQFSCLLHVEAADVTDVSASVRLDAVTFSCDDPAVLSVAYMPQLALTDVEVPVSVYSADIDFRAFLFGGIATLSVAVCVLCVAFGCFMHDRSTVDELTRATMYSGRSDLHKMLRTAFIKMGWYQRQDAFVRQEKCSVALLVVATNLIVCGVFLVLFHATASGFASDNSVLFEQYATSMCGTSATSPLPFNAFAVDAESAKSCLQRQVVGTLQLAMFSSAFCEMVDGVVVVRMKLDTTGAGCNNRDYEMILSGTCVLMSSLLAAVNDTSYASVTCGYTGAVRQRFAGLGRLALSVEQSASVIVDELPDSFVQHWNNASVFNGMYQYRGVRGNGSLHTTSSVNPVRFESAATAADAGDLAPDRVIVMVANETYALREGQQNSMPRTEEYTTELSADVNHVLRTRDGPRDGDLALGSVFTSRNAFSAAVGYSVELHDAGAMRYYNVRGSAVDIGASYGETSSPEDGDGVTISFYLKASAQSEGFVFVVTDAYHEIASRSSPLIKKAAEMIARNEPPETWFEHAYHIYASVYVNGPSSLLHFVSANPAILEDGNASSAAARSQRFVNLKWDVSALGLRRLFNGLWHHIVIILRTQNQQTKGQLMVDGDTSLSESGWNQCVPRRPTAVRDLRAGMSVPSHSASLERVCNGGVLYTGYLDGGVGHLQFRPNVVTRFDLWLEAPAIVSAHTRIDTLKFVALGWLILPFAVLILTHLAVSSSLKYRKAATKHRGELRSTVAASYLKIVERKRFMHKNVPLDAALRWLGLSDEQMLTFLSECCESARDPAEELFRVLFMARNASRQKTTVDTSTPLPTVQEWEELLAFDERATESKRAWGLVRSAVRMVTRRKSTQSATAAVASNNNTQEVVVSAESAPSPPAADVTEVVNFALDELPENVSSPSLVQTGGCDMLSSAATLKERAIDGGDLSKCGTVAATKRKPAHREGSNSKDDDTEHSVKDEHQVKGVSNAPAAAPSSKGGPIDTSRAPAVRRNTSSPSDAGSGLAAGSLDAYLPPALKELVGPLLMVLQTLYVWLNSVPFPSVYDRYYRTLLSFISIDWAVALPNIPTIVTPLLQFFAGMIVFAFLVYHAKMDEYRFAWHLARYVLKRDSMLFASDKQSKRRRSVDTSSSLNLDYVTDIADTFPYPFVRIRGTGYEYRISVLPVKECQRIDRFLGLVSVDVENEKNSGGAKNSGACRMSTDDSVLVLRDSDENEYVAQKPSFSVQASDLLQHVIIAPKEDTQKKSGVNEQQRCEPTTVQLTSDNCDAQSYLNLADVNRLRVVGTKCREHPERMLTSQTQTSVWPYTFPPSCCIVTNGKRCGTALGVMFVCGKRCERNADDSHSWCDYAVCKRHMRQTPMELIQRSLLQLPRQVEREGLAWLAATILLLTANAAYTPFLKTALMILACSPYYQCEFQNCWGSTMDQKFALTVYLCLVIVVVLGLGLPLLQASQLRRCRNMMRIAFFAEEYRGSFDDGDDVEMQPGVPKQGKSRNPLSAVPCPTAATVGNASVLSKTQGASRSLKLSEWLQFTSSDTTAMGTLYKSFDFEWLFLSPIILAWKVVLIVPVVFLPVDSLEQRIGVAAAQVAFSLFILITSPFISPIVDAMYQLGCAHQVLFLGVEALDVVEKYEGRPGLQNHLIVIAMAYLVLAVALMLWSNVAPVVLQILDTRRMTKVLNALGFQYSMTTSICLVPTRQAISRAEREVFDDKFSL